MDGGRIGQLSLLIEEALDLLQPHEINLNSLTQKDLLKSRLKILLFVFRIMQI
jgi:hypothetical protein